MIELPFITSEERKNIQDKVIEDGCPGDVWRYFIERLKNDKMEKWIKEVTEALNER